MIQDIAPKKLHNEYIQKRPCSNDYIAVFHKNKILIKEIEGSMELPEIADLPYIFHQYREEVCQYLFCIDEKNYFLYSIDEDLPFMDMDIKFQFYKIRDIRYQAKQELCFAVYTAWHLYQWYSLNRFCGRCGGRTKPDAKERMLYCENCGSQIYPRISPAVIVAVTNGNKILLTKYAGREYKQYALIAGFSEIGETAEETVSREVMEETGLRVKNIRYYKSQPWGIDGNLLFGYFAQLDGSDSISLDRNELSVAEWAEREELEGMDDSFSLTREMMRVFFESAGADADKMWQTEIKTEGIKYGKSGNDF